MKPFNRSISLLLLLAASLPGRSQNYQAIHGSGYAGALGVYNNPSSILASPLKWDITLLGAQVANFTNAVTGSNFPAYFSPSAKFNVAEGNFARKVDVSSNIRLLNTRFLINKTNGIAFGVNARTYTQASSGRINYNDSVAGPRTFLYYNEANRSVDLRMNTSTWLEFYGSYARTIWDQESSRLNFGATLKVLRGMSGAFASVSDVRISRQDSESEIINLISQGSAKYGYSANLGDMDNFDAANLLRENLTSFALDLGVEYLVRSQAVTTFHDADTDNDYEWKIGLSLLDLGSTRYLHGVQSRSVASLKQDISGTVLQQKFGRVDDLRTFNDSLATIVDAVEMLQGNFRVGNPARAVVNVDRYVGGNFYLNGELSVNLLSPGENRNVVLESRLVTITPRWETRKLGFFIPLQVTRHGSFWMGAAIKAGPLLLGTHNLLNVFSGNQRISGGGYIAFTIRPSSIIRDPRHRQYDCPTY